MKRAHLLAVTFGTGAFALLVASSQSHAAAGVRVAEVTPSQQAAGAPPESEAVPSTTAVAQAVPAQKPAANSVFAEGLGAGLAYSLNYERMVLDDLGVRVGVSYLSISASVSGGGGSSSASATLLSIPITASYIGVRSGKHALELGGGATLTRASGSGSSFGMTASGSGMSALGTAMIGYRIHPVDHAGFQFRVGLMALAGKGLGLSASDPTAFGVLPWGYISMGASF